MQFFASVAVEARLRLREVCAVWADDEWFSWVFSAFVCVCAHSGQ